MDQNQLNIPKGFNIQINPPEELRIVYRATGIEGLLLFPNVGVVGICSAWGYGIITDPKAVYNLIFGKWWMIFATIAGISAMVFVTGSAIIHLFGRTVILISSDRVSVSRRLFGLGLTKSIPQSEISHLEQIKDGGEHDDGSPSWGLRLIGRRIFWLLSRQPFEKSVWLGNFIAEWLHVEFKPSPKRPE